MDLGENIFKYRTRCNLSQGELADALEVSRQSVSKWENNSAVPELGKIIKMAALFDVSLDTLIFDKQEEKSEPLAVVLPAEKPLRTTIGLILLAFGLLGFLLSVFWGDHLRFGEEIGEIVSISVVLLSVALLAAYNIKVLAFCAVISFSYSVICFGFFNVTNLQNHLFVFLTNMIIMVWFIVLGLHANKESDAK